MVGGYIQVPQKKKTNNTQSAEELSQLYFRRKAIGKQSTHSDDRPTIRKPNFDKPLRVIYRNVIDDTDFNDDAASLDNWDNGLLRSSAGEGKELNSSDGRKTTDKDKKTEDKKTLSDQVAEGKYGLIEKELFQIKPKRPGVISYAINPEVPKDTDKNFGGINPDNIWLAEDHLLVLKGGASDVEGVDDKWKPIDNYDAPKRPVKIPSNPKIPPPFPVQLEEGGPIQFIGESELPLINPFTNETLHLFPPEGGFPKTQPFNPDSPYIFTGPGPNDNFTKFEGYPYPPSLDNGTVFNPYLTPPSEYGPPVGPPNFPFGPPFPFLLPNGTFPSINDTDFDEDDPSFFYPPPYSFVYKSNYTNPVEPGPLVPGIILPPPPNFFSKLGDSVERTTQRKIERTTTKPPTTTTVRTTQSTTSRPKYKNTVITTLRPTYHLPKQSLTTYLTTTAPPPPPRTTLYSSVSVTPPPVTTLKKIVEPVHDEITFIPKGNNKKQNGLRVSHPIYFEYFDARKPDSTPQSPYQHYGIPENPSYSTEISNLLTPTQPTPVDQQYVTQLQPQTAKRPSNAYLPVDVNDNYLYITPKPEIYPNGVPDETNLITSEPPIQLQYIDQLKKPFKQEIETIRQMIDYFKTTYPHAKQPQSKAVYEYSFRAINDDEVQAKNNFQAPELDRTPFKPMMTQYNPTITKVESFKYVGISSTTEATPTQQYYSSPVNPNKLGRNINHKTKITLLPYKSEVTTTANPLPYYTKKETEYLDDITMNYFSTFGQKIVTDQPVTQSLRLNEYTTLSPVHDYRVRRPSVSFEKQTLREVPPVRQQGIHNKRPFYSQRNQVKPDPYQNNYEYRAPVRSSLVQYPNSQQQNSYLRQVSYIRQQLRRYPSQQNYYQHANLLNDTLVNYNHPRPTINPDSEFINPSLLPKPFYNGQLYQRPPPSPPQRYQQIQNKLPENFYTQNNQEITLNRDILVNHKYPLPAINPDSEPIPVHLYYNNNNQNQQQKRYRQYHQQKPIGNGYAYPKPHRPELIT